MEAIVKGNVKLTALKVLNKFTINLLAAVKAVTHVCFRNFLVDDCRISAQRSTERLDSEQKLVKW
jgi:hypothetical protein